MDRLYNNDPQTNNWKALWKMDFGPVIQIFIWKCAHGILPTNAKTGSILHYIDPMCQLYHFREETLTHLLLAATFVWTLLLGPDHGNFDHTIDFVDWVNSWLSPGNNNNSSNVFATACWYI